VQANGEPAVNTEVKNKVTIITAVAKKKVVDVEVKKGELMEANMDAMEVKFGVCYASNY
jgi:hypothetical protein